MSEPDTLPIPVQMELELGWDADRDGTIDDFEKMVPEPLVLRGVLLTAVGLVGAITGNVLDVAWVEPAVALYAVTAPLGLAVWARRYVSPVRK